MNATDTNKEMFRAEEAQNTHWDILYILHEILEKLLCAWLARNLVERPVRMGPGRRSHNHSTLDKGHLHPFSEAAQ